ncbi:MAG: orotate phosphoribosyltransferase [Gammaproteobacteria bacterium]
MQDYQREFIKFAIQHNVLCFGEFTLKSGRLSPYFFNSGLFNDGSSLWQLGRFYAWAIQSSGIEFDMLFGPAYKGIPLASAVAIALSQDHQRVVPYCFNRKEFKDHGEGGMTFGAPMQGKILIVDDVISAGTSVNLSVGMIRSARATPAGAAIALDRQERGLGQSSAVQEVEQQHGLKVISIITLDDVIEYLEKQAGLSDELNRIKHYLNQYGVTH